MVYQFKINFLLFIVSILLSVQTWATDASQISNIQNAPVKVLLDTDPGGDDTFALLWLESLAKQGIAEIFAVTTVDGNVRSQYTFTNACKILDKEIIIMGGTFLHNGNVTSHAEFNIYFNPQAAQTVFARKI